MHEVLVEAQGNSAANGGGPLAPAWFVIPLAVLTLLIVASHVVTIDRSDMPPSRKRLRTVNGILMMFTIPLAAYAMGGVGPERSRVFVMVWTIVAGLVVLVLLLAIADLLNTWRMNWNERQELRQQIAAARLVAQRLMDAKAGSAAPQPPQDR